MLVIRHTINRPIIEHGNLKVIDVKNCDIVQENIERHLINKSYEIHRLV